MHTLAWVQGWGFASRLLTHLRGVPGASVFLVSCVVCQEEAEHATRSTAAGSLAVAEAKVAVAGGMPWQRRGARGSSGGECAMAVSSERRRQGAHGGSDECVVAASNTWRRQQGACGSEECTLVVVRSAWRPAAHTGGKEELV